MIKGIAFDMDGLMFDTERLIIKAWAAAGKQMGCNVTKQIAIETLGMNTQNTKAVVLRHMGNDFDYEGFRALQIEYMTEYIEENGMPLKPGLIELLDYLKANHYKVTVATSTEQSKARYYFQSANITSYFDEFVCGDMIAHGKPAPDIYLKACEIMGLAPSECLALEDSPLGILSAHRAGMKPVMIPDLVQPGEETRKLLYAVLPSLFDVIKLLEDENKGASSS